MFDVLNTVGSTCREKLERIRGIMCVASLCIIQSCAFRTTLAFEAFAAKLQKKDTSIARGGAEGETKQRPLGKAFSEFDADAVDRLHPLGTVKHGSQKILWGIHIPQSG